MTQSSCKRDTKSKSHVGMKLKPVRLFSCKHSLSGLTVLLHGRSMWRVIATFLACIILLMSFAVPRSFERSIGRPCNFCNIRSRRNTQMKPCWQFHIAQIILKKILTFLKLKLILACILACDDVSQISFLDYFHTFLLYSHGLKFLMKVNSFICNLCMVGYIFYFVPFLLTLFRHWKEGTFLTYN